MEEVRVNHAIILYAWKNGLFWAWLACSESVVPLLNGATQRRQPLNHLAGVCVWGGSGSGRSEGWVVPAGSKEGFGGVDTAAA